MTQLPIELIELVKNWYWKSNNENDVYSKFVFRYFCINALMAFLSEKDKDWQMLQWIYKNNNVLKETFENSLKDNDLNNALLNLQGLGLVRDVRRNPKNPIKIGDINNFSQVYEVIYRIRCNLFHGKKDAFSPRDRECVKAAGRVLKHHLKNLFCELENEKANKEQLERITT